MAEWFTEWLHRDGVDEPLAVAPILRQPLSLVGVALLAALAGLAALVASRRKSTQRIHTLVE